MSFLRTFACRIHIIHNDKTNFLQQTTACQTFYNEREYRKHCNKARPRERSDRGRFLLGAKKPLHTGVHTGCHYLICLSVFLYVCVSVCLCVTCVVFTYCESCTRPISTNPVSMEAGEYGLTRGTWFFARRLEVVKVAGLLWLSRCVFGEAGFFHFRP